MGSYETNTYFNTIITTILRTQEEIDIESLPKSEVFWGNISNMAAGIRRQFTSIQHL